MDVARRPDDRDELKARIASAWGGADGDPGATIKTTAAAGEWARRLSLRERELARSTPGKPAQVGGSVDYEMGEFLGSGGMGVVHAARQAALGRTVAIKLMRADAASDPDKRARFLAEALVTGNLEHPNIVPVYELGVDDDGTLFYAMKRVQGTTWKDAMTARSLDDNLDVLLRVCDAIAFAHARGIVHCDLKPANVMLGDYGETLVLDWGLAVAIAPGGPVAIGRVGGMGGTPAYMPPELAMFDLDAVSPATDVYLLCAILYELIAGRPPHRGSTASESLLNAAMNHIDLPPEPVELVDVAARGLLTDPLQRWPSVAAFAVAVRDWRAHAESLRLGTRARQHLARGDAAGDYEELARAVFAFEEARSLWTGNTLAAAGESEARIAYARAALANDDLELAARLVRESEPLERPVALEARAAIAAEQQRGQHQRRYRRLAWSLGEAGALALVVALVLVLSSRSHAQRERDAQIAAGERLAAEGYAAELGTAEAWLVAGRRSSARAALDHCPSAQRGWEWRRLDRCVRQPGEREAIELCRRGARLAGAAADAVIVLDGGKLAWLDPSDGRELRALAPFAGVPVAPTVGGALMRIGDTVRLIDGDGLAVGIDPRATVAAFAPVGGALAVADDAGGLFIGPGAGRIETRLSAPARALAWAADGHGLIVADADAGLAWRDDDGTERWRCRLDVPASTLAMAERAGVVAVASGTRLIFIDLGDGARRHAAEPAAATSCLAELPGGDHVAAGDVEGRITIWCARTGVALARIAAGDAPIVVLRCAGETLVAQDADGRIVAWRGG
ncbi:MAG TPA: serine/threonine-protein kinase [Planctomycetota bacterium]|nr:serine/threonine-protein kinase [Planctomycetota bacterium]